MCFGQQFAHTWLKDRAASGGDHLNLGRADVNTHNAMASVRQTCSADRPYVAQAEDADPEAHASIPL
jgi:hypothetical protein